MAPITSSQGILLVTPANAKSAETIANEEPPAFLFTHGTSTNPATGSQTRPSIFLSVIANASALCCGVPPAVSTTAAEAIAPAEPTSAWQPPVAPAINALLATIIPKAPDVNKKLIISSRVGFNCSFTANKTPGTQPALPAVGVAQIMPIAAFTSFVPIALLTASNKIEPDNGVFSFI